MRGTDAVVLSMLVAATGLATGGELRGGEAPSSGRLVDVGGHRMYISCSGEGTPTVVIDAGAGSWSTHFESIQAALAPTTRVCTFDRAGLGRSDPGPAPRTSRRMADELHSLLHAAGAAPPLLLVGHSLGGYNARIYQAAHPGEVGGLVLIDAAHEGQWERLPEEVRRAVENSLPMMRQQAGQAAAEFEAAFESAKQVPKEPLGDLPLVVLTAARSFEAFAGTGIPVEASNQVWMALQDELAALSTLSVHMVSDRGDHRLNQTDPDAVVGAIEQGIRMVRGRPQPPAGLGLPAYVLPPTSTPETDRLLAELEDSYRAMDVERFVGLFTEQVEQLDVNRRVHVQGRDTWRDWTHRINAAHLEMDRRHRGRARVGDVVIAEIEWSGTVRGEALGSPGADRKYRYTGLATMRIEDGKIRQQILYGDFATLSEQLGLSAAR
jgi:pimeloyl-ACP methyl ester carboxylesterase